MAEGWYSSYPGANQLGQSSSNNDHTLFAHRTVNDFVRNPTHNRPYFDSFPDDLSWQSNHGPQSPGGMPDTMITQLHPQGSVPIMIPRRGPQDCYSPGAFSSGNSSMLENPNDSPPSPYDAVTPSHVLSSSCPPANLFIQPGLVDPVSLSPSQSRARPRAQSSSSQTHRRSRHGPKSSNIKCPKCSKVVKNTSEAQKHRLQHSKPFVCELITCKRHREGFATKNDLERHRKTVHGLTPSLGEPGGYVCFACTDKSKFWPRKDNFRAHCQRKHREIPTQELLDRSKTDQLPLPSLNASVRTTASSLSDINDDQSRMDELARSDSNTKLSRAGSHGTFEILQVNHEDEELAGLGAGPELTLHHRYSTTPSIEVRSFDDFTDAPAVLDLTIAHAAYGSPGGRSEPVWDYCYNGARDDYHMF